MMTHAKIALFLLLALLWRPAQSEIVMHYIHTDHLGTPQMLTDENQNVVWRVERQTPFGEVVVNEDPDGDGKKVEFNLRFAGQYYDKETGLNYNGARYYDPRTGGYTQSDPLGLFDGPNTYGYAYQNPLRYSDPTGLAVPLVAGCALNPACAGAVVSTGQAIVNVATLGLAAWGLYNSVSNNGSGVGSNSSAGSGGTSDYCLQNPNDPFCKNQQQSQQCPRYNGPKPQYHVNPAHVPGMRGFNPRKTPLPSNAQHVYQNAVPNHPTNPTAWFGLSPNGQIYRYSLTGNGQAHFSGIRGVGSGTRNFTRYAAQRLGVRY